MSLVKPISGGNINVRYSGVGYFFLEARQFDGSALATPDTWGKVSLMGDVKFARKGDTLNKKVVISTNAANQEIDAIASYDASNSGLSTSAPDITVTFDLLESTIDHLNFYQYVRGMYFNICIPLGLHPSGATSKHIDYFAFGQFDNGGDITISSTKATTVPISFVVNTNVVVDTVASLTALDPNVFATAAVIPQYAGELRIAT